VVGKGGRGREGRSARKLRGGAGSLPRSDHDGDGAPLASVRGRKPAIEQSHKAPPERNMLDQCEKRRKPRQRGNGGKHGLVTKGGRTEGRAKAGKRLLRWGGGGNDRVVNRNRGEKENGGQRSSQSKKKSKAKRN